MRKMRLAKKFMLWNILFCLLVCFISSAIIFMVISTEIDRRMSEAYISNLKQVTVSMESNLRNLSSFSHYFTPYGKMGEALYNYINTKKQPDKTLIGNDIQLDMNILKFSNPNIGMTVLYTEDDAQDGISTWPLKSDFEIEKLPVMLKENQMTYYGPHTSMSKTDNRMVISSLRSVDFDIRASINIYVETGFDLTQKLLENSVISKDMMQIMLDEENTVIYSADTTKFPIGSYIGEISDEARGNLQDYLWYQDKSSQGWRIVSLISNSANTSTKLGMLYGYVVIFPLLFAVSILFSLIMWRIVNRPLQGFYNAVNQIEKTELTLPVTGIYEFDTLNDQIHFARIRINELISEIKSSEKLRTETQIGKLRAQINPHFVLNSLNTIHWLALGANQEKIDLISLDLAKILSYNLRKDKISTTLGQEIEVTTTYLELQQNRYDFTYEVENKCDDLALECVIPRFVLQPLVENSILHSSCEMLKIKIIIENFKDGIKVKIKDNGGGVSPERLEEMRRLKSQPEKLGIGLAFVTTAMNDYFGKDDLVNFDNIKDGFVVSLLFNLGGRVQ